MSTNLKWIGEKARKEPKLVFTSLYHHVTDVDNLRACYDALPTKRAAGIDGVIRKDLNPYRRAEAHRMINRGAGCGKAACPVLRGAGGQL